MGVQPSAENSLMVASTTSRTLTVGSSAPPPPSPPQASPTQGSISSPDWYSMTSRAGWHELELDSTEQASRRSLSPL